MTLAETAVAEVVDSLSKDSCEETFSIKCSGPSFASRVVGLLRRRSSSDLEKSENAEVDGELPHYPASTVFRTGLQGAHIAYNGLTKLKRGNWAVEMLLTLTVLAASVLWRLRCSVTVIYVAVHRKLCDVFVPPYVSPRDASSECIVAPAPAGPAEPSQEWAHTTPLPICSTPPDSFPPKATRLTVSAPHLQLPRSDCPSVPCLSFLYIS
jgi:hypothetical protein